MNYKCLLLFILFSTASFAQVSFTADVSRNKIGINEVVKVEFKVNQNADNFRPPSFSGFRIVGGPMQSINKVYKNGKSSFEKSYTYSLKPEKRGKLTIGQAEITFDDNVYKTSPVEIEVTAAVDKPNENDAGAAAADGIHLIAEVSKSKPYLNEGIYVVYKLYVSQTTNVRNWRPKDDPKFENFWSQNIDIDRLEVKEGEFGGEPYRYVELRKTVLYPQKTGELKIEPLSLSVSVEVPTNRRDFFGRRHYDVVEKDFSANTKIINVQPLPEEGKPADFTGAVGEFDFSVTANKSELDAKESFELKTKVSGNGNLKLFQLPKIQTPSSFEVYDPERQENISTSLRGMRGSVTENYTIVPEFKGDYSIKPISFSYFNPRTESYEKATSSPINIKVNSGPEPPKETLTSENEEDVATQNKITSRNSFNYIKLNSNLKTLDDSQFFKSTWYWVLFLISLLVIPVMLILKQLQSKETDETLLQQKHANKLAKKYLTEAKRNIGDNSAFYEALERALHNFLKAKLKIQTAEMSKDKIKELLKNKSVSLDTTTKFLRILEDCEMARYTPSAREDMQSDYDNAAQVISEIDKEL